MLLNEKAIADVILLVSSEDFYRPAHKAIFDAIIEVYDRGQGRNVDPLTVNDALEGSSVLDAVGGPGYLVTLQSQAPVISHVERYATIVREHAIRRKMIATGQELAARGREPSAKANEALAEIGSTINEMTLAMTGERRYTTAEHASQGIDDLVEKWGGGSHNGTLTGFKQLDKLIDGLHRGRFYIVGGRPGEGKSVLAANIATEFALSRGKTVLFFSLEMGEKEVAMRMMYSRARIPKGDMESGWITHNDWIRVAQVQKELRESNLIIDASPSITVQGIEARCRQVKASLGSLDLVVVDYLQLMGSVGKHESRQIEVSGVSRRLKGLSRTMDVPVLTLSQFSRDLEKRVDKRPQLSDLRESGSLEQDADCVMLIYRDWDDNTSSENEGFTEIIVGKNRQGPRGSAELAFIPEMSMFANPSTTV